jgi:hypothetical protein
MLVGWTWSVGIHTAGYWAGPLFRLLPVGLDFFFSLKKKVMLGLDQASSVRQKLVASV